MPVELSDLLGSERWIPVEVNNVTFNVAYRPGNTSLKRQAELQKRMRTLQAQRDADEEEQAEEVGKLFCEMVCNWDLTSKGKPLPITAKVVTETLPGAVFSAIMEAISSDSQSGQEEKKALNATSGASSRRGAKSAVAQNGIPSSARHDTWAA